MASPGDATAVAPPATITITLPPGVTPEGFADIQRTVVAVAICVAASAALVLWDYLVLLPQELQLYRSQNKAQWKGPGTWAFLVLRYAGPFSLITGLFFTSVQSQHCQLAASLSQGGIVLVTASAGIIFCFRVFSLWSNNTLVKAFIGGLLFINVGSWIAVASQLRASVGPPTAFGSNCVLHPIPAWSPLSFASSVVFDTTVLIFTLIRLWSQHRSKLSNMLMWDNIAYFLAVTITNIVVLIIQSLQGPKIELMKPVSLPWPTFITTAMGVRVFLNLRLFHTRSEPVEFGSYPMGGMGDSTLRGTNQSSKLAPFKGVTVTESSYVHSDAKGQLTSGMSFA